MNIFDGTVNTDYPQKKDIINRSRDDREYKRYIQKKRLGKARFESNKKPVSLAKVSIQQTDE